MDEKQSILIVDDDDAARRSLSLILERKGYDVETAATGQEALRKAGQNRFNVTLLDIRLPDVEGIELIAPLKEDHPDMAIVMVTGYASMETAVRALNEGASAYITKPLNIEQVLATARDAIEKQRLIVENKRLFQSAERELAERRRAEEQLRQSYDKLQATLEETVHALVSAAEARDPYTAGHQRRVAQLACAIAKEMELSEDQTNGIRVAASLHDIGKIYLPGDILNKPSRLIDIEMNLIRIHPEVGYDIIKGIEFPWPVATTVLQHHERMDGSGYPQGLSGDDILLEARVLAVADVVEAMCSHRPFRPALGPEKALEEIIQKKGRLYDPAVVDACVKPVTMETLALEPAAS